MPQEPHNAPDAPRELTARERREQATAAARQRLGITETRSEGKELTARERRQQGIDAARQRLLAPTGAAEASAPARPLGRHRCLWQERYSLPCRHR